MDMREKSTLNQLTLHLYNETDWLEKLEVENLLEEDQKAKDAYQDMIIAKESLPAIVFSPSDKSVRKILQFAFGRPQHCVQIS